jgi:hypothetical protein
MATQRLLSLPGEIGNPRERVEQPVRKSNAVNPAAPRSNRVSRQAGAPVRFERRKAQTPERSAPDRCVEWGGTSASDERPRCCAGLPRGWGLSHVPAGGSRTGAVGERDIGVARCFPATLGFLPGSAVSGLRAGVSENFVVRLQAVHHVRLLGECCCREDQTGLICQGRNLRQARRNRADRAEIIRRKSGEMT